MRAAFEEALDDLHRAAEILAEAAHAHLGGNRADLGEWMAEAARFAEHIRTEWNR